MSLTYYTLKLYYLKCNISTAIPKHISENVVYVYTLINLIIPFQVLMHHTIQITTYHPGLHILKHTLRDRQSSNSST
jgi:hypothetical protein